METMLKRLSKVLMLTFTSMALSLAVGGVAHAADHNLYVGGTQVTDENKADIPATNGTKTGTASYNPGTKTLTLNNYRYTGSGYHFSDNYAGIWMSSSDLLNIELIGDSTITMTGATNIQSGIKATGDLAITGTGKLTIECGNGDFHVSGIYVVQNLTIGGNVTVKAAGGNVTNGFYSMGIMCERTVTINGNAKVEAKGGSATSDGSGGISAGICSYGGISISGNARVKASGGNVTGENAISAGLYGENIDNTVIVTASGRSLEAIAGTCNGDRSVSYGIYERYHDSFEPSLSGGYVKLFGYTKAVSGAAYVNSGTSLTIGTPPQDPASNTNTNTNTSGSTSSSYDDDDDDDTPTSRYDLKTSGGTGAGGGIVRNSDGSITFSITTGDGNDDSFDHFKGIQIDGWQQRRDVDFIVTRGSTIITLKSSALKDLTEGTHYLAAFFDDGDIIIPFDPATVKAASQSQSKPAPKTGEV